MDSGIRFLDSNRRVWMGDSESCEMASFKIGA